MENISESVPIAMPLLSFLLRDLDGYGWFLACFDGNEEPPQSEEFWGTLAEISAFRSSHHCCVFFSAPRWSLQPSCAMWMAPGQILPSNLYHRLDQRNGTMGQWVQPLLRELLAPFTRTLFGSLPRAMLQDVAWMLWGHWSSSVWKWRANSHSHETVATDFEAFMVIGIVDALQQTCQFLVFWCNLQTLH